MSGTGVSLTVAQKGLDALWLRQGVISSNLANIDTPGYKSRTVSFESALQNALNRGNAMTEEDLSSVAARVEVNNTTSAREDGNNVDADAESIEMARTQMQYQYLVRAVSAEIQRQEYVLNETR